MLGLPNDFSQTNATPDDLRQWIMSFYAQDTFKISPRFTLNFGVRWEPTFSDPDKYGRGTSFSRAGFDAGQHSTVYPNAPAGLFFKGDPGIPDAMWNGHMANFAPRVGLVWNPHGDGRDTLRIGGGILYDVTETWFNERETTNAPIGTNIDTPNPVGGLVKPVAGVSGRKSLPAEWQGFLPDRRRLRQHADRSQAHLRGQLERHLSASVPAAGWFRRVTWATRPPISGAATAK